MHNRQRAIAIPWRYIYLLVLVNNPGHRTLLLFAGRSGRRDGRFVEAGQVLFELLQRRFVDVHHVPRVVIRHRHVLAKRRGQVEVVERILRRQIGRCQVVPTVGNEDLQVRVLDHGGLQRASCRNI